MRQAHDGGSFDNNFGIFVSGILLKLDGNSEHCLDLYRKEILNLEK